MQFFYRVRVVTPGRFDKFLGGDKTALTDAEKAGLNKFMEVGCTTCHMGNLLGGTLYQKAGLIKPWPNRADQGRFDVTKNEADKMMFKVPSLRNVAKTATYFHDASSAALEDAVVLGDCVRGTHNIELALRQYEALRRERVRDLVLKARKRCDITHGKDMALTQAWYQELREETGERIINGLCDTIQGGPLG